MEEMYGFLLQFIRCLLTVKYDETSCKVIESKNGYNIKLTKTTCEVIDQQFKNRVLISLDMAVNVSTSLIYRNTINACRRKYTIPSFDPIEIIENFDKDMHFNMSLTINIPTYEHILFAFELRKLLFETDYDYHYRSILVHPRFIDFEILKNTEIP